ncbi:MAG: mechanosensitive ion channel family protein [Emergencia sp.]|nr:mechanosensitive ion channel family protein [Emergencia sp.]
MSQKNIELLIDFGTALAVVLFGWIAIRVILRIERKALERSHLDEALYLFILKSSRIILWIVLIVSVLPMIGVSPASLVAVLGAGGAAIALALKDSLGNVAGGIIILMNKPFNRGDTIEVGDTIGVVDAIDLLTTRLHTFDNKVVTIPNGTITTSVLTNYSRETMRRVDCTFGISYQADIGKAKEILFSIAENCPKAYKEPEFVIGVASHGDNAILMDLKVWCSTEDYFDVKYYLEEQVKIAFDQAGIEIPYPQVDVHII